MKLILILFAKVREKKERLRQSGQLDMKVPGVQVAERLISQLRTMAGNASLLILAKENLNLLNATQSITSFARFDFFFA
jgi:hypothetical protein